MSCCYSQCNGCSAKGFCTRGSTMGDSANCRLIPVVASTAVAYETASTNISIPYLTLPTDRFILDVQQILDASNVQVVDLDEAPQETGGEDTIIPVYDRYGNYVYTDSLARTIIARRNRALPWVESCATRFRAVLGSNPTRINIIDCLVPTVSSTTTTTTTPGA